MKAGISLAATRPLGTSRMLLTVTLEADLGFASPADFDRFTTALTDAVAELARRFAPRRGARRFRLLAAAHPAVGSKTSPTVQ